MLQEQPLNDKESEGYPQFRVLDGADKVAEIRYHTWKSY
jgi:hypothetical protein